MACFQSCTAAGNKAEMKRRGLLHDWACPALIFDNIKIDKETADRKH